jgi:hypothetical protein
MNLNKAHEAIKMSQNSPCSKSWNRSPNTWSPIENKPNKVIEDNIARKNHFSVCASLSFCKIYK